MNSAGHVVGEDGIEISAERRKAIGEIRPPTDKKSVRGFLGLANYFRGFVSDYATRSRELAQLSGKNSPWSWEAKHQKEFEDIRSALMSAPLLSYLDHEKEIRVRTDASDVRHAGSHD